jgi:hypothetical protein
MPHRMPNKFLFPLTHRDAAVSRGAGGGAPPAQASVYRYLLEQDCLFKRFQQGCVQIRRACAGSRLAHLKSR